MKRADTYLCHTDLVNGIPVGDGKAIIDRAMNAAMQVAGMTKVKFRIRLTARGRRGITLKEADRAAVYLTMKRMKK